MSSSQGTSSARNNAPLLPRPSVSSRLSIAVEARSLEAGDLRNSDAAVPEEHLEEIEAIKRYEVSRRKLQDSPGLGGGAGRAGGVRFEDDG